MPLANEVKLTQMNKNFKSFSNITRRVLKLGSEKWIPHVKAREMEKNTPDLIILTIGEPDIPVNKQLVKICSDSMKKGRTRYSSGRGEPNLIEALSSKYSKSTGSKIKRENILCFPGTQTALFIAMMGLAEKGDEVLVGDPLYASYEGVIEATGAKMVKVPLQKEIGFSMTAEALEKAITPNSKVLLLNSPHNPTGAVLTKKEIEVIGDICLKNNIWIISDEVYADLIYEQHPPLKFSSPLDFEKFKVNTVVVSSISKSHAAPGFRSGWVIGPSEFCSQLLPLSETILFGNQPFIADMTAYALENETITAETMRKDYNRRAKIVLDSFRGINSLNPFKPNAGMFIMVDISNTGKSSEDFTSLLLEKEHVATMPGSSFGDQAKDFIRMSLTVPDEMVKEACERMKHFVLNS